MPYASSTVLIEWQSYPDDYCGYAGGRACWNCGGSYCDAQHTHSRVCPNSLLTGYAGKNKRHEFMKLLSYLYYMYLQSHHFILLNYTLKFKKLKEELSLQRFYLLELDCFP